VSLPASSASRLFACWWLTREQTKAIQEGVPEMDRFAITGGENVQRCYMNDVWEYHVEENRWAVVQPCTFCQSSCAREVPAYEP
jgi:hypothetical protein